MNRKPSSRRTPSRRVRRPILSPAVVEDEERLSIVTGEVLVRDGELRELSQRIIAAQNELRAAVNDDAWAVYLRLESLVNERSEQASTLLARWAFSEGRRSRR